MPFRLSRGGNNVPVEVQRWQFFLRRQGSLSGNIDGRFGNLTFQATSAYQMARSIPQTGALDDATLAAARIDGYSVLPDDYYDGRGGTDWPAPPPQLKSPSNAARNAALGCFVFTQLPEANRSSKEQIEIGASCDGTLPDWEAANIVKVAINSLGHVREFPGFARCHKLIAERFTALVGEWDEADMLHLLFSYAGGYNSRYIRGATLDPAGHGPKQSVNVSKLSNHSFGSAFDFNAPENWLGDTPRLITEAGSVRDLVPIAVRHGFYWGGWFSRRDGMHFEFADFDSL